VTEDLRVGVQTWTGEKVIYAEAALRELAERFTIVEAAFDPWRFGAQALDLSKRGLRMVEFPQSDSRSCRRVNGSRRRSWSGALRHPDDRVLPATSPPRSRSRRNGERPCSRRSSALRQPHRRGDRGCDGRGPGRESARAGEAARVAFIGAPPRCWRRGFPRSRSRSTTYEWQSGGPARLASGRGDLHVLLRDRSGSRTRLT
jgi:hypothetical protein